MKRVSLLLLLLLIASPLQAQESETFRILRDLIRIDTTNPPGNETRAAEFIQKLLQQEGIPSEIIESAEGRGNLIARLKGTGTKPAMILLGHLDVVPVDQKEWSTPPFAAEVVDGKIWGRGSLDMKGLVAMEIVTLLRLKREKVPLAGDVILVLCADEEAGGKIGAEFLVKNHWEKIQARYLFNEGSVGVLQEGLHLYPIQVAEKGVAWMELKARGRSGHGSMPTDDNAVVKLAEAVEKLAHLHFPVVRTEVMATFLEKISDHLPFPKNLGARYLFHPIVGPAIRSLARHLYSKDRVLAATLSHTISPTMLAAGYKANVIPAEASATIDARILPGETPEGFRDKVRLMVGEDFDLNLIASSRPNESDFRTDYFRVIEEVIKIHDPEAVTAPILSAGATDSRFFREKGVIAYGIIPLLLTSEELKGLHGKNERIPVEGLEKGSEIVYDLVKRMQQGTR